MPLKERNIGHPEVLLAAGSIVNYEEELASNYCRPNNGMSTRDPNFGFETEIKTTHESGEIIESEVSVRRTTIHGYELSSREKGMLDDKSTTYDAITLYGFDSDQQIPFSVLYNSTSQRNPNGDIIPVETMQVIYGQDTYCYILDREKDPCPTGIQSRIASILGLKPRQSHWG